MARLGVAWRGSAGWGKAWRGTEGQGTPLTEM